MTTASTPTDLARPPEEARVCIVAITRHGAAQAAQLARDLPEAHICTAAKF
ncbi:MAG TPA: cobalamin biosynthesis protein CbiG, partial [Acidovorax temperans]|nr:cobalamin biosynthesis protein CbiG [Acidovorax temperans]